MYIINVNFDKYINVFCAGIDLHKWDMPASQLTPGKLAC